jgi:hypothetical protein
MTTIDNSARFTALPVTLHETGIQDVIDQDGEYEGISLAWASVPNDAIGLHPAVHAQEHQGGSGGHRP